MNIALNVSILPALVRQISSSKKKNLEAAMQNQTAKSLSLKPIAQVIVVALALIILSQGLDLPARHVLDFLTAVLQHTVVLLPSLAMTAWQGLHPAAFEQPHLSLCALGHSLLTYLASIS